MTSDENKAWNILEELDMEIGLSFKIDIGHLDFG